MKRSMAILAVAGLALAGCGNTTEDRALSGAGIGAGAGAVVGAVTGLSVVQGVVLGAAAGGLTGALTRPDQVNLGKPAWRGNTAGTNDVQSIQSGLAALGYRPGPADGVVGTRTREAITQYQRDHRLLADGRPSAELARHIEGTLGQRRQLSGAR